MQKAIKLIFVLAVLTGFANLSNLYSQSGPQKPRKQKNEPNNALRKFISEDVPYIITESEKRAFEMLKTDEERENFIDYFWYLRDPNPDTIENEFREEYYERIAYANEKYTSGIPGWRTDRGRIYITFGKPDSIESHPRVGLMSGRVMKGVVQLRPIRLKSGSIGTSRALVTDSN